MKNVQERIVKFLKIILVISILGTIFSFLYSFFAVLKENEFLKNTLGKNNLFFFMVVLYHMFILFLGILLGNVFELSYFSLGGKQMKNTQIFLGKKKSFLFKEKEIYQEGEKHILCEFPTRTGFTSSILIPNLLKLKTNLIIFDRNEEAIALTKKYREKLGKVFILKEETTMLEIQKISQNLKELKLFTIYIFVPIGFFLSKNKRRTLFFEKINFLLGEINQQKIECCTFVNEAASICSYDSKMLDNLSENNKFLLRFQDFGQIKQLEQENKTKINIENFDIVKTNPKIDLEKIFFNNMELKKLLYFKEPEMMDIIEK